jgi:hypothetical protein
LPDNSKYYPEMRAFCSQRKLTLDKGNFSQGWIAKGTALRFLRDAMRQEIEAKRVRLKLDAASRQQSAKGH